MSKLRIQLHKNAQRPGSLSLEMMMAKKQQSDVHVPVVQVVQHSVESCRSVMAIG